MKSVVSQITSSANFCVAKADSSVNGSLSLETSSTALNVNRRGLPGFRVWHLAHASFEYRQNGIHVESPKYLQSPECAISSTRGKTLMRAKLPHSSSIGTSDDSRNLQADDQRVGRAPGINSSKKRLDEGRQLTTKTHVENESKKAFDGGRPGRSANRIGNGAKVHSLREKYPAKFHQIQGPEEEECSARRNQEEEEIGARNSKGATKFFSSDVTVTGHGLGTYQGREGFMKTESSVIVQGADAVPACVESSELGGREDNTDSNSQTDRAWASRTPGMADYNGEKVIERKRKGRVVMRYKPLGIEYLYGRTKPTRLYGPLNSRGEVPGSGLAPVPKPYRERCDQQHGWTIKEVVNKVLELNHWEDIDSILNNWVGRYNRKNFPSLMAVMTSTGALKHSARLFTWMKAQRCYRARNDIYNLMIWLYARHNRVDRVRSLFREMQEWRCKPDLDTYNALINAHGRAHQWKESLLWFDRMLRASVPPSTSTYNNLISSCGNSRQWQRARDLYERMRIEGIEMDIVTHNALITALKIGKQHDMAITHFEQMLQWEVQPDCITLNIVISCFSKMDRHDEAIQLFNSMRSMKWVDCEPDLVTYTTVMHVYSAWGQVENVKLVFEMIADEGIVPNLICHNTLLGAYASLGMDVEANEVFDGIQAAGFEPDIVSYTSLMNAFSKARKPDGAVQVFDLLKRRSCKPNILTYNTLLDAYSSAGRVTEALSLLSDMDYDGVVPTVVTVCSLIVACRRGGRVDKVSDILQSARFRKIPLNINVYNTMLSLYSDEGMFEEANQLFRTVKREGIAPDAITFSILISGASKAGSISQAQRHFDDMLAMGIGGNVGAYSALIHAYAEQGQQESAHALLTRMKDAGVAPNIATYTSLLHAYRTAGMAKDAIAVFEEMEDAGVEPDAIACCELFTTFNSCRQPQNCLRLWRKRRDEVHLGAAAYRELTKACSLLKDWSAALDLLQEMHQVGVAPDFTIGHNILRSVSEGGQVEILEYLQDSRMSPGRQFFKRLIDDGSLKTGDWLGFLESVGWTSSSRPEARLSTAQVAR